MADAATISVTATMLPDEIAKTITGSMTVTPTDANDKWYYKLTALTTTSAQLIAGSFLNYTAIAPATGHTAITTSDKVRFLFVQNQSSGDGLYLCFDGQTAVNTGVDMAFVGASETWFAQLPNTTVGNLTAISSDIADAGDATVNVLVIALLDDVA
ncbi:hypothetical protein HX837_07350 [Marine Group I thaumarchaeote]|uniref:Uncharacterized protein n=1 Tax=Marine Group I thaumarchaeote TaxID=2511932 RepID=A0A7K4MSR4_9ARCH|nr:hypothetical protein [Marine Group I thaumarchaeote]